MTIQDPQALYLEALLCDLLDVLEAEGWAERAEHVRKQAEGFLCRPLGNPLAKAIPSHVEQVVATCINELHTKYSDLEWDDEGGRFKVDVLEYLEVKIKGKLGRQLRCG